MRRAVLSLVVVFIMLVSGLSLPAFGAGEQYTSIKAIGYGPLEGELINPSAIGLDEVGKIHVLDRSSGIGSIYFQNGNYYKSFTLPEGFEAAKVSPTLSIVYGNICYIYENQIVVSTRDGLIVNRLFSGFASPLKKPLQSIVTNDMSIIVADESSGLIKFDQNGKLVGTLVKIGENEPIKKINAFDIAPDGKVAILSIIDNSGVPSEEIALNEAKIFTFDKNFKKQSEFTVDMSLDFNPKSGMVRFDKSGNIYFMALDMLGLIIYGQSGNKIAESSKGMADILPLSLSIGDGNTLFLVNGNSFYSLDPNGKLKSSYGAFGAKPMQFGKPKDIAICGNNGLAVFDDQRNDIQFFDSNGLTGTKTFSAGSGIELVLGTSSQGTVVAYSQATKTLRTYDCSGNLQETVNMEKASDLDSISVGKDGEIWACSAKTSTIYRFNRIGGLILSFGHSGTREGQLNDPYDILFAPDGNVYVLDSGNGRIQVFKPDGSFVRQFGSDLKPPLKNPHSFCLTKDLELVIADTGNDRIVVLGLEGSFQYATGITSPAKSKNSISDYWANLGTYSKPTRVRAGKDSIYVLDSGNIRIQVLQKIKFEPKISVDVKEIDFGVVTDEAQLKEIKIKNIGNGMLEGTVEVSGEWIEVSKTKITGNEIALNVKLIPGKVQFWNMEPVKIIIKTNGGNTEVVCKATKKGLLISLQIGSEEAKINNIKTTLSVPPSIIKGSTVVPLRFIGEALGATVDWEATEKKITYTFGDKIVILWIGNTEALVNNIPVTMTIAPTIIKGSTMVPLRFISEALGASVEWIAESKTINIYYPPNPNVK